MMIFRTWSSHHFLAQSYVSRSMTHHLLWVKIFRGEKRLPASWIPDLSPSTIGREGPTLLLQHSFSPTELHMSSPKSLHFAHSIPSTVSERMCPTEETRVRVSLWHITLITLAGVKMFHGLSVLKRVKAPSNPVSSRDVESYPCRTPLSPNRSMFLLRSISLDQHSTVPQHHRPLLHGWSLREGLFGQQRGTLFFFNLIVL